MYKFTIFTSKLNTTYICFSKKSATKMVDSLVEAKCEFVIERLGHIGDTFFWCENHEFDLRIFEKKHSA